MRLLSLIVAAGYILFRLYISPPTSLNEVVAAVLILGASVVFPLACIWFAEELGDYVGASPGTAYDRPTPAGLVRVGGWVLLILPFIVWFFVLRA